MSTAQYRLLAPGGAELEAGSGDVTVAGGILELRPGTGAALRLPPDRIAAVTEPQPFAILVTLDDGTGLELSRLGVMRTQLLAELRDAEAGAAAHRAGAVGDAVRFTATVAGDPAELRVFDDALIAAAGGRFARLGFAFIGGAQDRDYTVSITVAGGDPLEVTRLGRRTGEFVSLLGERLRAARGRTAAFLASLLPGLDPIAQRTAAGLLRDGVAASARDLDAIHPELSATLLRIATRPDRADGIQSLAQHADLAIGFKQVASVRRPAVGGSPWHDPAVTPQIGQHDSPGGLFRGGLGGALAAGMMEGAGSGRGGFGLPFGGPAGGFGGYGGYWGYRALGAGMNWGSPGTQHQMTPRAGTRYGVLTPETEDLAALTATGDDPTVLAFALISLDEGRRIGYEVLNLDEPMTYVYEATGRQDPMAEINRALDDAGFAAAELAAAGSGGLTAAHRQDAATSPLATGLVGQVPHGPDWSRHMTELLAGTGLVAVRQAFPLDRLICPTQLLACFHAGGSRGLGVRRAACVGRRLRTATQSTDGAWASAPGAQAAPVRGGARQAGGRTGGRARRRRGGRPGKPGRPGKRGRPGQPRGPDQERCRLRAHAPLADRGRGAARLA